LVNLYLQNKDNQGIGSLLNPKDHQNVPAATKLLDLIYDEVKKQVNFDASINSQDDSLLVCFLRFRSFKTHFWS
jgi:hypothetical protein